jgi:ABC-type polysaccharide/polyol phosphate export permease
VLTPIAAAAVAAQSVLITAIIYTYYRDIPPITYTVAMAVMAAFISYGRFALEPLS